MGRSGPQSSLSQTFSVEARSWGPLDTAIPTRALQGLGARGGQSPAPFPPAPGRHRQGLPRERARKGEMERKGREGRRGSEEGARRRERPRRPGWRPRGASPHSRRGPGAHLPGSSWRTRRAPSWTCSPPTSSRSPTFSCARALRASAPFSSAARLRLGSSLWLRAPSRAPVAPPCGLPAAPRARPWPRPGLGLRSGRAC